MTPGRPDDSTKRQTASTLGPIEPLANCPSASRRRSFDTVISPMGRALDVP